MLLLPFALLPKVNESFQCKKVPHPGQGRRYMISCYVDLEILSSDTYRISQLEPSNGRLYATTAHVIQLKAWRSWDEDDDDSSENSDDEPEMQSPKRTVRKPVLYRAFM
ncbi:hypothetical protein AVEN_88120-1 [Araneus ventricosus]|uniref:Uncharacterized protein n=1 Tax=Araneus ventricosus TaxID=182803 RepID=A0A4Y2RK69_ARAVE|nr:hypothetical protein AVEN_88120-1 [Araneus ventricosus]